MKILHRMGWFMGGPESIMKNSIPPHIVPELVKEFSYQDDARLIEDPWPIFAELNGLPDIFYTTDLGGYWVVTRKGLMEEVMSRPDLFSSAAATIPRVNSTLQMIPPQLDPPEHTKFRKIIAQRVFSARALSTLEQDARRIVCKLLAATVHRGEGDFLVDFARPMPITVFLDLLGMPIDRVSEFSDWIETFFRGRDPEAIAKARKNLSDFAQDWLVGEAKAAESHILSELRSAQIDGRPLSNQELSAIIVTLFLAGLDTVTAQMAHAVHFLATHPDHCDRLVSQPELIPDAVEELLRRFGIANVGRRVAADCEFHGVAMKRDDLVLCSTPTISMDERAHPHAGQVDFDRPQIRKHAAFGAGPHLCVGAFLARTELRVLLEETLPGLPGLRLKPDSSIEYVPGKVMTMNSLPVEWDIPVQAE
jgi:cytochrome P450